MNSYRLVIRDAQGDDTGEQGTGWFVRPDLVVTAFHVVGKKGLRKWLHEREGATYWLTGLPVSKEVQLFPGCFDPIADVALLECASVRNIDASALAVVAKERDYWWADGFPGTGEGEVSRLSGKITANRDKLLELLIEQGTDVTWRGISGTAIFIGDNAVGVVTDEVPHTNTLKAASFNVVATLIAAFDAVRKGTGLLKNFSIDWNGDVHDLREQLASNIEIPKLFEVLRKYVGEGKAIRIVAGIEEGAYIDARTARLGSTNGIAFYGRKGARALYVGTEGGIYRIRANDPPELFATGVTRPGQLFLAGDRNKEYLYVSSLRTHTIHRVCISNGQVETIAGNGAKGFAGDGGPALNASFHEPRGISAPISGDRVYIADTLNHRIRRVNLFDDPPSIATIAGNGTAGYSGDHGPALAAQLNCPTYLELSRNTYVAPGDTPVERDLFISDTGNHCVRKVRLEDGEITTVVGTGQAGFSEDGATGSNSAIDSPHGLALADQGLLFVDRGNNRICLLDLLGKTLTTVAGNGKFGFGGDCRDARLAELSYPAGLCFDPYTGVLYVADGPWVKAVSDGHGLYVAGIGRP